MDHAAQLRDIKQQSRQHSKRLGEIKKHARAAGYHPAPKYGAGEWVHATDCTIRSIRFGPLGWHWVPSISRTLLLRAVRRDVAARA